MIERDFTTEVTEFTEKRRRKIVGSTNQESRSLHARAGVLFSVFPCGLW